MEKIPPTDPKIQAYYALDPKRFSELVHFQLDQASLLSSDPPELKIVMMLAAKTAGQLEIHFTGVSQLILKQWGNLFQIPLLEIVSIRDRQWDQLNYSVKESENETISFFCMDFEVKR